MHISFIPAFLLATIAAVSAVSLNDIDPLSPESVTPGCLSTYSQPIDQCPSASDFRAKKTCSDDCISALTSHQQVVILSCRQAFVSTSSLLRRLLDGGLVSTLCPTTKASASASTSASASVSPSSTTTKAAASSTVSKVTFSGFLTMTIPPPAPSSTDDIPEELTLDESTEPTVSEVSALAQSTESPSSTTAKPSPTPTPPTDYSTGGGTPNGAGVVRTVLAAVVAGFSVAVGAALL